MANDISYLRIQGDGTTYSFNDADAETRLSALQTTVSGHTSTLAQHTSSISTNAANISANSANITANTNSINSVNTSLSGRIGTLSNLNTSAKTSTVAAINEVNANTNSVNSAALKQSGTVEDGTSLTSFVTPGIYVISGSNTYTGLPDGVTYGTLLVLRPAASTAAFTVQMLIGASGVLYIRSFTNSSWSSWRTV